MSKRKYLIKIVTLFVILLFFGCDEDKIVKSSLSKITTISKHSFNILEYKVPFGIFRGVLWPCSDKKLSLWVIRNSREYFYDITVPFNLSDCIDNTSNWSIKKLGTNRTHLEYKISNKKSDKSFILSVPIKNRRYSFSSITDQKGLEVLFFMDIDENIQDVGIVGMVY